MHSATIVRRARALTGVPFRPQGREPATGVDCIGLALYAYRIEALHIPRTYRLRGNHREKVEEALAKYFRKTGSRSSKAGDLMLVEVKPDQLHLAIACGSSFVHADAGVRKVVERPGEPPWPVVARFRPRRPEIRRKSS